MFFLPDDSDSTYTEDAEQGETKLSRTEHAWRCPDQISMRRADSLGRLFVSRWASRNIPNKVSHSGDDAHVVVSINLSFTSLRLAVDDRLLHDGTLLPGSVYVTVPRVPVRATYDSPCDELHLYVPHCVFEKCFAEAHGDERRPNFPKRRIIRDHMIERLARLLASDQLWEKSPDSIVSNCIANAIVSRLVEQCIDDRQRTGDRVSGLPRWRLNRAVKYIEENLAEPIRLDDIARNVGLSRMHFAAQFRITTGVRPHEYLVRRRVEMAKKLLSETQVNALEIALQCGFRSQAHFISVFSRYQGETPSRWRKTSAVLNASS